MDAAPSEQGDLLEVGRIVKPHGLRGEVIVQLFTNRDERLDVGTTLQTADGPLVVRRSARHQHRWVVKFAGVNSREAADALRERVLLAAPLDDPEALWVHELVGSEMRLVDGEVVGVIISVMENPAGDILETDTGKLVPLRFVVDHVDGVVRIDPPPGLLDVN